VCSQMAASEWSRVVNDHASKASGSDFDADQFKKKVQRDCMTTQLKASVKMILFLLGYLLTGTFVFSATEGWPLFYSFYFSVVTMSTVGYGGSAGLPGFGEASTTPTRLFCIFYSAVGIFGIVNRISSLLEGISISTTAKLSALAELEVREQKRLQKQISIKSMYGTQALPGSRRDVVEEPMAAWKFYTLNIVLWVGTVILWVLVNGAIFCGLSPGLTFFDGVYFSWITATTIGYSDSELKTTVSRAWCCAFIIISTALITVVSAVYTSEKTKWQWAMRRWKIYQQTTGTKASLLDADLLKKLQDAALEPEGEAKGGSYHDRTSFLVAMLAHLDLVPRIDVALILQYFDHLDLDADRTLSMDELLEEHRNVLASEGKPSEATPLAPRDEAPGPGPPPAP